MTSQTGGRHAKPQPPRPRRLDRARTLWARAWARLGRAHAEDLPRLDGWV